jgi:polysaccharide biosynthesis transport protein
MELRRYFSVVWKWWWLILLSVLIASFSSYIASKRITPLYRAKTTLMVGRIIENPDPNSSQIYLSQQLASTYQQMVSREPVLAATVKSLGWDVGWEQIAYKISASVVPNTQLIEIYAVDANPQIAKLLSDSVARELVKLSPSGANQGNLEQTAFIQSQLSDLQEKIDSGKQEIIDLQSQLDKSNSARDIQDLQNQIDILDTKISNWQSTYASLLSTIQGGDANTIAIVEEATLPTIPFSPNNRMNVLLAAAIGLVLAIGGIFVIEYFDDTLQALDDTQELVNLPTLAKIDKINGGKDQSKLVALENPSSPEVDSFRMLRINLQSISNWQSLHSILFTSAEPSVGKTVTASNLAVVMAQSGQRVILVDADLRKPSVHRLFRVANEEGLIDLILQSEINVMDCLKSTEIENLKILPCGAEKMNSIEALGSDRMKLIAKELSKISDFVIFDCPPALLFSDTYLIAKLVNGVVIVSRLGRTRSDLLKQVVNDLRLGGANLLGVVVQQRKKDDLYGYRYNKYYSESNKKRKKG